MHSFQQYSKQLGPSFKIRKPKVDFLQAAKDELILNNYIQAQQLQQQPNPLNEYKKHYSKSKPKQIDDSIVQQQSRQSSIPNIQETKNSKQKMRKIVSHSIHVELKTPHNEENNHQTQESQPHIYSQKMQSIHTKLKTLNEDDLMFTQVRANSTMKTIQLKSEFLIKSGQLKNPMLIVHGNIGEEYLEVKPESKNNQDNKDFAENGLKANKNLKNYDCWDDDFTPQEWIDKCNKMEGCFHGSVPFYDNNNYIWSDVQVLAYDEAQQKFKVKILSTGAYKLVGRLSLKFNLENEVRFLERVQLAKQRWHNVDDEIRFYNYVNKQDEKYRFDMPPQTVENIQSKVKIKKQNLNEIVQLEKLYKQLMHQAKFEYGLFMKKSYVLREMVSNKNSLKFQKLRITKRNIQNIIPKYGLIYQQDFGFNQQQELVQSLHFTSNQKISYTLINVATRSQEYEKFKLFNTGLNQNNLPQTSNNFEFQQKASHIQLINTLKVNWRNFMASEVQDNLRGVFRFYITDVKFYQESDLKKLLKRIDSMVTNYMRENILLFNLQDWCHFIKKFTIPNLNEPNPWYLNPYPLMILNLTVSQRKVKDKKEKKKKDKDVEKEKDKEKEEEEELIFFEPNLHQVQTILRKPVEWLYESIQNFSRLERDLVPLVDLKQRRQLDIEMNDPTFQNAIQQLNEYGKWGYEEEPSLIQSNFRKFSFLMEKSVAQTLKHLFGEPKDKPIITNLDKNEIEKKLADYTYARQNVERACLDIKNCVFFQVRTKNAKEILTKRAEESQTQILLRSQEIIIDNIVRISKNYSNMCKQLVTVPKNELELVDLKNLMIDADSYILKCKFEVEIVGNFIDMIQEYGHSIPFEQVENYFILRQWPTEVKNSIQDGQRISNNSESKFLENLESEKLKFQTEIEFITDTFNKVKMYDNYKNVKDLSTEVMQLHERFEKAQEKIKSFNERENLFKLPITEYDELIKLQKSFQPYHKLWDLAMEFDLDKQEYYTGVFLKLNYSNIDKKINQLYLRETLKLSKMFQDTDDSIASSVIKELKADIDKFREKMWIIELLTTEAMIKKLQHWKDLWKECSLPDIEPNDEMTFQVLIESKLSQYREIIEEVSKRAEKQYSIEKKLNEIVEKMKALQLELYPFKNSGTFVLRSTEEIQQIMDDLLNILMMMKASPYIKPVIYKANQIEGKIVLIQDTLEGWIKCQRGWMYLEPIFSSDDIKKKMPIEKQKFENIDRHWRSTMEQFQKDPSLWETIETDKYKNDFDFNNKTLDQIQKSLSEYLESKRRSFPRFYFLSDEELLEILAQTKDPQTVQKHINKCFEAIQLLEFRQEENVVAMISAEKEKVKFNKSINVNEGDKKGNVEKWLGEIEQQMIDTLKKITKDSLYDEQTPRTKWVCKWPGQCILAVNMIRWTKGAEMAILGQKDEHDIDEVRGYFNSLQEYYFFLEKQLKSIVELVRTDLSQLERLTLSALVVIDVHAKDTIESLVKEGCSNINEFKWISQLRYCWQETSREIVLKVKMINASLNFGFEYLGNSSRLVITPLTDRCYRTLMGAFHLFYGGAPEGPAGTGKTETTKDLAKALAVQCVVFNCSDGLNYLAMSKFFKGLASSGAWCCFDEFNRIDLEVLSVIAQQVLTIQTAIKDKKKTFIFEGDDIILIPSCAINITMNPGYAGRSELPDNLKALFRPCAMMVPDYALISEIFLYSVGFQDARNLARKIVASLRLSSEQLSSQDHYDFGMRALKAILTAAGNLKRVMNEIEDIICLRALMDVNLPKFTFNDVPLFMSITSDLFPGISLPEIDYGKLEESLQKISQELNIICEKGFLNKCIQLFDTINVRHGLMVVGSAFSGKSKVIESLQKSISSLKGIENFVNVFSYKLNPKSISSDQLYGKLDNDTKTWSDGVIAIIMRECAQDSDSIDRKWIIFDGPVDAVWIENMNTVLDDNKKLCLTSGEIIKMTNTMTMMFEVEDLSQASPATVSRCGMVFLESHQIGWLALIKSYSNILPKFILKYKEYLFQKLQWISNCSLGWCKKNAKYPVYGSDMILIKNLLNLLRSYLDEYTHETAKLPNDFEDILGNSILFSTIWSIGASLDESCRRNFNDFLIRLITADSNVPSTFKIEFQYPFIPQAINAKLPEKPNLFELTYEKHKNQWIHWTQTQPNFIVPKGIQYHSLLIPTSDSIRNNYILNICIKNKNHLLVCGPTGTGKTVNILSELTKNYFNADYTNLCTSFSGQTTANQIQKTIETRVCTRRRKGWFGPEEGKKCIVIFIDDLNMPQKERFGAQPPIELLRQWMDYQGWYDLETKEFKFLCDIVFIGSLLPPQGGRNSVTLRYLRHFNLLYVQPFENDSLKRIFGYVLEWYFMNLPDQLPKSIMNFADNIVSSTIELYNQIQTSKELLPTPAKSHYIYNLRDISKVFQGITKATNKSFQSENDFLKLWAHECQRVFQDRLINADDQTTFDNILKNIIKCNLKRDWNNLVLIEPLLFASFVPTIHPDGDLSRKPYSDIYCELIDRDALGKKCKEELEEYNNYYSSNRMDLVLFMNAIQHVIKIVRVLTTTFGHALLVGVGGSGRKSLATLSSFISWQTETQQIDEKNWTEELQRVVKMAGIDQKQTVFLYSDTQIIKESMVEDICNILNNGEVPNLFPQEEKIKIIEEMSSFTQGSPNEKYNFFVQKCRQNLHLTICMSPVGEAFRRRLRTFPALVNCTTIDWFLPWPEEALKSTADNHLKANMKIADQFIRNGLVEIAVDMQIRVSQLTEKYYQELRRYYYVTPTSYLVLLNTFQTLLDSKQKAIQYQISRYDAGVDKIVQTEKEVAKMQKQLEELQPKLEKATVENSQMLIVLQKKQKEAEVKKQICEQDEKETNIKRDSANVLRIDCKQELDKVLPLLAAAAEALDKITKDDMTQLKSFTNPPAAAAIVLEGVCYAFNEDQNVKWKPKEAGSMEKVPDFWEYAKKFLLNDKLIKRVKEFKEEQIKAIPQAKINKLKNFMQNPLFEREKVMNASKAAGNLSFWIRAVVDTFDALLVVEPKRAQLQQSEEKLKEAEEILDQKKAILQEVLDLLNKLESDYSRAKSEKDTLEREVNRCKVQLDRAQKLITGLGGEKENWKRKSIQYTEEAKNVIGDCILCSGIIAYLGAFPISYRESTIISWQQLLQVNKIIFSPDFQLQKILSDPIIIGQWVNNQKLPNDNFSIDNAIILKNSTRWPLMIDPQTQANTWIKNMESSRSLLIIRTTQSQNEIAINLETAIQIGKPILLENIGEQIDSVFESVLQLKLVKQGSSLKLKFGDKLIDYNSDFKFYMTTKQSRPHYSPEICVKITLLNFQVTLEGLLDQILNIIVKLEQPSKEEQRQRNIKEFFENKNKQKNTEDVILKLLYESSGNLLDDESLINTLQQSKHESIEIEEKLKKQEVDRELFNQIRNSYKEVAKRVANLYFVILDLALIEPTYQWSLEFYIALFERSVRESPPGKDNRNKNIIDKFQQLLYEGTCRSLLEKDKLIFSFLMCMKIMSSENKITPKEIRYTMVGCTYSEINKLKPDASWLSNKTWINICETVDNFQVFNGLDDAFMENPDEWEIIHQSQNPQDELLPEPWEQNLSNYQKLILQKILRPDKFTNSVQKLITNEMGRQYMEPPPFNLEQAYSDADAFTPLIFILSPGADPRLEITNLAEKLGFKNTLSILSLGQGQGEIAEIAIKSAVKEGKWVLLQNCHLASSFMPDLERIQEQIISNPNLVNRDFRIWLTSMPSSVFPVTILMKGIKMTYEPPRGLRNNLMRSFLQIDAKKFEDCEKLAEWKKLFFGLSFFHALIIERRKFGPLGWNIPYEFTAADLAISVSQLKMFLNEYEDVPFEALNYMVAEANYGGRVTDPKDRRLISILLKTFYTPKIFNSNYAFSPSKLYFSPLPGSIEEYKEYIRQLPINDPCEVFGLHQNAEISSALIETNQICNTILTLLPREVSGQGISSEELIKDKCRKILLILPKIFDIEYVQINHPVKYEESMNTVLQQEIIRFNKLLKTIRESLQNVINAIDGLIVMSSELEIVFNKLFDNQVPDMWNRVSYPSLKPLASYINDFNARLLFINKWIYDGVPSNFWLSGFFFTQSFLTGTMQNYARKYKIPIDTLSFDFFVIPPESQEFNMKIPPKDGCYIHGLFLDGAKWDLNLRCLTEAQPKVLYYDTPYIWFIPSEEKKDYESDPEVYECPLYKTSRRAGTLSTTGHSTNFVLSIYLPIGAEGPEHWVKRGVALLTQMDD